MTINKEKTPYEKENCCSAAIGCGRCSLHGMDRLERYGRTASRRSGRYGRARKHGPGEDKPSEFSESSPAPSASAANEASRVEPAAVSGQATAPSGQAIGYASPLNIPLRLSANYGELRGGHFHAGIDIKTQGVIGKPVFAMDDGYVSRINVSPSGFGKALYITHPDGRMTVYGHLERFIEPIEAYVHELQYARKTFALDFAPPETRFPVKRGERIGLSGNRGSSGGPHLHLEVREGAAQRPLNVLARGFLKVPDTIPARRQEALTTYPSIRSRAFPCTPYG